MAAFREAVLSTCFLIPTMATFYFWVVALGNFIPPHNESSTKCTAEVLKSTMNFWMRLMVTFIILAITVIWYLRKKVDAAAYAEAKGDSLEEEAYKLAREDLSEAIKATNKALAALTKLADPSSNPKAVDAYAKALWVMNLAYSNAESKKPKEGLARLPIGRQIKLRLFFFLVILLSLGAGVCASVSFYYLLRLQIGCVDGFLEIAPFVVIGIIFLAFHVYYAWVAFNED